MDSNDIHGDDPRPLLLSTPESRDAALAEAFADTREIVVPATNIHLAKNLLIRGINEHEAFFAREGLAAVASMLEYDEVPNTDAMHAALTAAETRLKEADALLEEFANRVVLESTGYPVAHRCVCCGRLTFRGKDTLEHAADCPVERARRWRKERGT